MAPKIGPVPAMLRNWTINTFHEGIAIKSTPSAFSTAGTGRDLSGPKTFSTNFPYRKYPAMRAKRLIMKVYIGLSTYNILYMLCTAGETEFSLFENPLSVSSYECKFIYRNFQFDHLALTGFKFNLCKCTKSLDIR